MRQPIKDGGKPDDAEDAHSESVEASRDVALRFEPAKEVSNKVEIPPVNLNVLRQSA